MSDESPQESESQLHIDRSLLCNMSNLEDIELIRKSDGSRENVGYKPESGRQDNQRFTRGKSKYLLSIGKRPRKNVKKRMIEEMKPLRAIGEDEEMLLNETSDQHLVDRDHLRAPKAALGIFLLVCCLGSYQLFVDYWNAREISAYGDASNLFGPSINTSDFGKFPIQTPNHESIADIPIATVNGTLVLGELNNLANVFHEPYNPSKNKLYLWHIPRSGSTTVKRIAANCMGLTLASEVGKSEVEVRGAESTLKIVEGADGMHFANVDMSYPEGISRANTLHIGSDPRIDLVSSAYLYHTADIFDADHKGYMVAMMRHPIERAVSLFYNMRRYPQYATLVGPIETVEMYARSSLVENNWMTRFLSNTLAGKLLPEHEAMAKEVLRTKCIIGLLSEKTESLRRLELFFNTKAERSKRRDDCTGESKVSNLCLLKFVAITECQICNVFVISREIAVLGLAREEFT